MPRELKLPILGLPTADEDTRTLVREIRERNTRYSQDLLHKCYENVLYDYNRQWVTFDTHLGQFRPKRTAKWIPKPTTNRYSAVLRPLIAALAGTDPILQYIPVSEEPADLATANVASRIIEVARHEVNVARIRPRLARWVGLTGNGWLVSGYDNDIRYGMEPEQYEQCVGCGTQMMADDIEKEGGCPGCPDKQSPGFKPAFDQTGQPIMGERPRGRLYSELATIFEMEYDHEADSFEDSLYAVRMRSRDREWAKSRFGMSDLELDAAANQPPSPVTQQRYLQSLAFISPLSYQTYLSKPFRENRVLVTDLWIDPTVENPQGYAAILIGDTVVYSGPYRYHAPDSAPGQPAPMRTVAHFGYQIAAGRVAYRTPADDLTGMQKTRNELESIYKLHSRRGANSIVWLPDGANISKMTGEEGLVIRYSAMSQIPPPRREPGLESPRFIRDWIELIDASMEVVAGSVDVLRGEAPPGLEAYSALQALEAKAVQAMAESRSLWQIGWAEWSRQMLGIFKEYCLDDRELALKGESGAWSIEKFKSADMRGGVRVVPDLASQPPSSPVAKRAGLEQAQRMGLYNPADPQERYRGLQIIGLPELMQDLDLDTRAAAIENDQFYDIYVRMKPGTPPNVNPMVDNDIVHLGTHRRFRLSDKGRALGPVGTAALDGHMAQHEFNMMRKAQQAAEMQAMGPGQAGGEATGGKKTGGPSAEKTVKSESGAASQPARANDMGKPKEGKRASRLREMKSEQNSSLQ